MEQNARINQELKGTNERLDQVEILMEKNLKLKINEDLKSTNERFEEKFISLENQTTNQMKLMIAKVL